MNKFDRNEKDNQDPLSELYDIEKIDRILNKEEMNDLRKMFDSIDNFNVLIENFELNIANNNITKQDIITLFDIVKKKHDYIERRETYEKPTGKMGLARTFFELPEILSRRIRSHSKY